MPRSSPFGREIKNDELTLATPSAGARACWELGAGSGHAQFCNASMSKGASLGEGRMEPTFIASWWIQWGFQGFWGLYFLVVKGQLVWVEILACPERRMCDLKYNNSTYLRMSLWELDMAAAWKTLSPLPGIWQMLNKWQVVFFSPFVWW